MAKDHKEKGRGSHSLAVLPLKWNIELLPLCRKFLHDYCLSCFSISQIRWYYITIDRDWQRGLYLPVLRTEVYIYPLAMNYFPARKCLHRYLKVAVCKKSRLSCGNLESTSITQELLVRSEVELTLPQNCSGFYKKYSRQLLQSYGRHCQSEQSTNCGFNSDMKTSVLPFLKNHHIRHK